MKHYLYGLLLVSLVLNPVVSVFAAYAAGQDSAACMHMNQTGDVADISAHGLSIQSSHDANQCCQQGDECGGSCNSCSTCHTGALALINTPSQDVSYPMALQFVQNLQLNGNYQQANFRPPRVTS